ncbi:MAG: hypothetical protein JMHAAFGB_00972 [Dehalococcoides mccartyi]|nr:hypothetical protein [Dehalococcoides mccartyi]
MYLLKSGRVITVCMGEYLNIVPLQGFKGFRQVYLGAGSNYVFRQRVIKPG